MNEEIPIGRVIRVEENRFVIEAPIEHMINLVGGEENLLKLLEKSGYKFHKVEDSWFIENHEDE